METTIFSISGISCNKCVQDIESVLVNVDQLTSVQVFRNPDRIEISSVQNFNSDELQTIFKELGLGKYTIGHFLESSHAEDVPKEVSLNKITRLFPLFLVIFYLLITIFTIAFTTSNFSPMRLMSHYMGGFFLSFSFFKLLNLRGFVDAFHVYDPIAKYWKPYGYFYAFIELIWGISYLISPRSITLNASVLLILAISSLGVWKTVRSKKEIQCACLGTLFNLPMTHITIVENVSMVSMAGLLLYSG